MQKKPIVSEVMTKDEVKKIATAANQRDHDQKMRFNRYELGLVKATFADNEELLFAIRKVMFQFELSEGEVRLVKQALTDPVYAVIRKFFLPELESEAPLFQMTDMINTLSLDMKTKGVEDTYPLILAKEIEMTYLNQQLEQLKTVGDRAGNATPRYISLQKLATISTTDAQTLYAQITARNYILSWIDSNLQQIQFLAGKKEETVDETLGRLAKNSAK